MKTLLFAFVALNLSACAYINIRTPVATVAPSEILQNGTVEVAFKSDPARLQTSTNDASERPPTFDNINEGTSLLEGDFNYAPAENFQIGLGLTTDIGLTAGAAYQFIGKPWAMSEPGWSAAVHVDYAITSYSKNGNQNGDFGSGGYGWRATIGMNSIGGGVSGGYRWNKDWMGFLGTSLNSFQVKTKIDQDANGNDAGGNYTDKNSGDSWATGGGIIFGSGNIRVIPTVQWVEYRIDRERERGPWWGLTLAFGGGK